MPDKWPVSGGHWPPGNGDVITDLRKSAIKTQKVTMSDNQSLMIKNLLTTNPSNSVGIGDYTGPSRRRGGMTPRGLPSGQGGGMSLRGCVWRYAAARLTL